MLVSIGILAHNEEHDIGTTIADLAGQNLLLNKGLAIEIHVVANGCTDNTVGVSKTALQVFGHARHVRLGHRGHRPRAPALHVVAQTPYEESQGGTSRSN